MARVDNLGGEYVLIPIVKFIQSTYEGPPYKNLGMEQILRREQEKRDPEAVLVEATGIHFVAWLFFRHPFLAMARW